RPDAGEERACARRIAEHLARRAFRPPVTGEDVEAVLPFFDEGRRGPGGFHAGIEHMIAAVLDSPDVRYRAFRTPYKAQTRAEFALSDLELASRLSFFLWSQGPDETLLDIAAAGQLRTPGTLEAQALRMLRDPRASALVRNFALKWLELDTLGDVDPDP